MGGFSVSLPDTLERDDESRCGKTTAMNLNLLVNLEAMTPSEYEEGGAGLHIGYGIHEMPFGVALLATTTRGICNLHFLEEAGEESAVQLLHQQWGKAELTRDQSKTQGLCDRIFPNPSALTHPIQEPLTVVVKGTNFQIQVWKALLNLPFGTLTTYQALAANLHKPTAARAIGNAVGKNSIGYLIPCHRVIRASGELGGYRWGIDRKAALLAWEAAPVQSL